MGDPFTVLGGLTREPVQQTGGAGQRRGLFQCEGPGRELHTFGFIDQEREDRLLLPRLPHSDLWAGQNDYQQGQDGDAAAREDVAEERRHVRQIAPVPREDEPSDRHQERKSEPQGQRVGQRPLRVLETRRNVALDPNFLKQPLGHSAASSED